jgi:hypothetical protein
VHITEFQFIKEVFTAKQFLILMHNFKAQVSKMVVKMQTIFSGRIGSDGNFYMYPNKPKIYDIELLAISAIAESFSINSENSLFNRMAKEAPGLLTGRISRPRFNIRRRFLQVHMEDFLELCRQKFLKQESIFIIDSMPLPVCKLARVPRLKVCKDNQDVRPRLATCYAKNEQYYGFKMHLITTQNGLPAAFSITSSHTHDLSAFENLIENTAISQSTILGDKGYVSNPLQLHLFENKSIEMKAQPRINMKTPINWTPEMSAVRKRIETVFSQCADQFRMGQNFAKTLNGLVCRINSKLAGMLFCQLINIQNGRNPSLVKSALFA